MEVGWKGAKKYGAIELTPKPVMSTVNPSCVMSATVDPIAAGVAVTRAKEMEINYRNAKKQSENTQDLQVRIRMCRSSS